MSSKSGEDLFALEPTQFPSLVSEDYVYEIEIRQSPRGITDAKRSLAYVFSRMASRMISLSWMQWLSP